MKVFFERFFFAPSSGQPLALLRIVIGTMMLVKGLFLYPHIDELYGQFGYLQSPLMEAISGGNLSSLSMHWGVSPETYSHALHAFFVLHLSAAFCFAIGLQTRLSNLFLWATQAMLFQLAWVSAYGIDAYSQNICFFLLWLPSARFYSMDAWLGGERNPSPQWICTFGLRCLQIYLLLTYVDAGISKALGMDWWTGAAIWDVLHLPEFNHLNFYWMASFQWVPKLLAWGTLVLETFYIFGVWIPGLGRAWTLSIIAMHLTIAFLMGLTLFGITLALVNAALFLAPQFRRWLVVPAPIDAVA